MDKGSRRIVREVTITPTPAVKGMTMPKVHSNLSQLDIKGAFVTAQKVDESDDGDFYSAPRFVHHIDDHAQEALAKHYHHIFFEGADVLDLCSSWVSHFPGEAVGPKLGRVAGLGMSELELPVSN